jgi:hypothetical protein
VKSEKSGQSGTTKAEASQHLTETISNLADANKTDCANSVAAVAETLGITDLNGKRANEQIQHMEDNWKKVTPAEAQELANQGKLAVAGVKNDGGHGHVALAVPGSVDERFKHPKLAGGSYNSSDPSKPGAAYSKDGQTVNYVWRKSKIKDIQYYTPNDE